MTGKFPQRPSTDKTAEIGINVISTIFNDHFGWVFRRTHQEHDFGVDAYIDYVTDGGNVTGQFIAAQIKTGKSYLSSTGNMHWYKDTKEHLNYFLNLPTRILLIICDPDTRECYWACLDKNKVDFRDGSWRHPVPKSQKLSKEHVETIRALFGNTEDHMTDFEQDINFLKSISDDSFIQYSIPKEDIENCVVNKLRSFIGKITRNEQLTLAVQGKLYISTYGYEHDSREVHQIKEVQHWTKKARKEINEWYLCAGNEPRFSTLLWIATCTCGTKAELIEKPDGTMGYLVESEIETLLEFLNECFIGLNEATDKWGWSEKYNSEISTKIRNELFPNIPHPRPED